MIVSNTSTVTCHEAWYSFHWIVDSFEKLKRDVLDADLGERSRFVLVLRPVRKYAMRMFPRHHLKGLAQFVMPLISFFFFKA